MWRGGEKHILRLHRIKGIELLKQPRQPPFSSISLAYVAPQHGRGSRPRYAFSYAHQPSSIQSCWQSCSSVRWTPQDDDEITPNRSSVYLNPKSGILERYHHRQTRWSSSNEEKKESSTATDVKTEESSASPPDIIDGTDPEFARYLAGGMKPPTVLDNLDLVSVASGALLKQRRSSAKKRSRTWALDNDKDLYKQIIDAQISKREESHRKTAANVYRALIGNVVICSAKFAAWLSSGSSAMLAEFIHSVVDCGNQSLLLVGLRDSNMVADRSHPYGYGKSIYFWALVSALGTFFLGAGVSMTHAVGDLMSPSLHQITWEVWTVLVLSFCVDGYVLKKTIDETLESKPEGLSYWKHIMTLRDPAILAVLLEDGAACIGIVFAITGIVASHYSGNPIFDGIAGVGISALLGAMGIALVRVNHRFLLGQGVDREITDDIGKILMNRRSIDSIRSIQSQWTGPETFSYKAEVDFDGTYLAAKLMPIYQQEFLQIKDSMDEELQVLLALYAEDVMRTVEREVRQVEAQIRQKYPGAEYIELEPMSMDADRLAIDDNVEAELRRVESDALNRFLKSLKSEAASPSGDSVVNSSDDNSVPPKLMNGGIKENANPAVLQVHQSTSRHDSLYGWASLQTTLNEAAFNGNPTDRAVLSALQDAAEATSGRGVSIIRSTGLVIPERITGQTKSVYVPLEFGSYRSSTAPRGVFTTIARKDEIDTAEIFDIIRNIQDPEHPLTLEQLSVVSMGQVTIQALDGELGYSKIDVRFTPTIPHCSMATLIGLCIRVKLLRSLPGSDRFKVTVRIEPGTHNSEVSVNQQLADKERVCAALENKHLLGVVNKCIAGGMNSDEH